MAYNVVIFELGRCSSLGRVQTRMAADMTKNKDAWLTKQPIFAESYSVAGCLT